MKWTPKLLVMILLTSGCDMKTFTPTFESSKNVQDYPSGSTASHLNENFYVMGDDASDILILDEKLNEIDRIPIFQRGETARLPKASKADIESSVVLHHNGDDSILFLGSGSLSPQRDSAFRFDPKTKVVKRIEMHEFYGRLREEFSDLNIEAAATIGEQLLLGIRANKAYPDNYLALAEPYDRIFQFARKIKLLMPVDHAGVSGMDYDESSDILFITFSTEDTGNSFDDGRIGESYLAAIYDIKSLLQRDEIEVSTLFKLSDIHADFKSQKIESVSIFKGNRRLLLVADDDMGNTKLFTLRF